MTGSDFECDTTLTIDCSEIDEFKPLANQSPTVQAPRVVLLRHLEAISDHSLRELGAFVGELRAAGTPWIVATLCCADGVITAEQQRVIGRFDGIALPIPNLQDRPDDIAAIVRYLLARHPRARMVHLSDEAISELSRASWPGNIRQLDDVIRSIAASRVGEISVADLPIDVRSRSVRRSLSTIDQLECEAIMKALSQADGNKVVAARTIGLSRSTIYRKIRAYGLDPDAAFF